ncbi:MAG: ATP-binding protein, partial [bacterium]|nr:ATP-binding protein [bacterium]
HDLQEPLRMVFSYLQLIKERYGSKLDSDADEFINYAVDGAKRMQGMLNDLLNYSRVTTQGKPLEKTDCKDVIKQVLSNLQIIIKESNANIVYGDLPIIIADTSQLIQLFQNLIINAIKFCKKESPYINILAKRKEKEWLFSVQDNGIGINLQYSERIFKIFQRLHTRSEYPGTGIGLAICKKTVERHNGNIWVESELGKGSTFFFTIPITRGDYEQ